MAQSVGIRRAGAWRVRQSGPAQRERARGLPIRRGPVANIRDSGEQDSPVTGGSFQPSESSQLQYARGDPQQRKFRKDPERYQWNQRPDGGQPAHSSVRIEVCLLVVADLIERPHFVIEGDSYILRNIIPHAK